MQTNARSSSCARNLETFSSEMSNRLQKKWRLYTDHVKLRFIGLGNMGSRIAERLLDRGYQVAVYDLDPGREAAEHGGRVAKSSQLRLVQLILLLPRPRPLPDLGLTSSGSCLLLGRRLRRKDRT